MHTTDSQSRRTFGPLWAMLISGGLLAAGYALLATPETASGAKPVREKATYGITFSGDLGGVGGIPATGIKTMRIQDDAIAHMGLIDIYGNRFPIDLYTFFDGHLAAGEADLYFKSDTGNTATGNGIHGILPIKKNPANGVTVTIFFGGYDINRDPLTYRLDMEGEIDVTGVPDIQTWAHPGGTIGDTITRRVILNNWSVRSDSKGGRGKALQAEGLFTLETGIDITGVRTQ